MNTAGVVHVTTLRFSTISTSVYKSRLTTHTLIVHIV